MASGATSLVLGRRERARTGPRPASGALSVRLQRRLRSRTAPPGTPAHSGTAAGPTMGRRSSFVSQPARRLTARTGRCRAGGGSRRCAASPRSSRSTRPSSFTSRTGRDRCPALEVSPNWTYGGTLQGLFGRLTIPRRGGARVPDTVERRETIPTRASSTSTPSTPSTAGAGNATRASSRTGETAPSVTASSRKLLRPATRRASREARATAGGTGSGS